MGEIEREGEKRWKERGEKREVEKDRDNGKMEVERDGR